MVKLGWTDLAKLVTVRVFGGTDMKLGRNNMIRVSLLPKSVSPSLCNRSHRDYVMP